MHTCAKQESWFNKWRIDVAFSSSCTSRRHSGVVARHPSGWGTSLLEGIFPLNEPIRARLFLLAPRPKSRRHHINKGRAWFEARVKQNRSILHPTMVVSIAMWASDAVQKPWDLESLDVATPGQPWFPDHAILVRIFERVCTGYAYDSAFSSWFWRLQYQHSLLCLDVSDKLPPLSLVLCFDHSWSFFEKSRFFRISIREAVCGNQTPFFFYPTNLNWQLDQTKKKHSAAPPGIELGSSDCRSDALTTELRSHDRNCVRIFVFHQTVSSVSLRGDPSVWAYKHVENNETRWI